VVFLFGAEKSREPKPINSNSPVGCCSNQFGNWL